MKWNKEYSFGSITILMNIYKSIALFEPAHENNNNDQRLT